MRCEHIRGAYKSIFQFCVRTVSNLAMSACVLWACTYMFTELKESDLNAELRRKKGIFYHGKDKQGHKIR